MFWGGGVGGEYNPFTQFLLCIFVLSVDGYICAYVAIIFRNPADAAAAAATGDAGAVPARVGVRAH